MTVPTLPLHLPPTRKAENLPTPITAASVQSVKQEVRKDIRAHPLQKEAVEEKIRSGKCRHEIREIGNLSSRKYVTKYVVDLDVTPIITEIRIYPDKNGKFNIPDEYRSDVVYGTNVKALSTVLYSEGVMSNDRIAAFLNAAENGELGLSAGSVYGFCRKLAGNAESSIQNLEGELLNQGVVLTDATTVTVNGEQNYIWSYVKKKYKLNMNFSPQ